MKRFWQWLQASDQVLGVDVHQGRWTVVGVRSLGGDRWQVAHCAESPAEHQGAPHEALRLAWLASGASHRQVVLAIPEDEVWRGEVSVSAELHSEDLDFQLALQLQDMSPWPLEEVAWDYLADGQVQNALRTTYQVAVIPLRVMQPLLSTAAAAGLETVAIELPTLARQRWQRLSAGGPVLEPAHPRIPEALGLALRSLDPSWGQCINGLPGAAKTWQRQQARWRRGCLAVALLGASLFLLPACALAWRWADTLVSTQALQQVQAEQAKSLAQQADGLAQHQQRLQQSASTNPAAANPWPILQHAMHWMRKLPTDAWVQRLHIGHEHWQLKVWSARPHLGDEVEAVWRSQQAMSTDAKSPAPSMPWPQTEALTVTDPQGVAATLWSISWTSLALPKSAPTVSQAASAAAAPAATKVAP